MDKICKDCRYYHRADSDIEDNHRCLHQLAEFNTGGITTPFEVRHYTCKAILEDVCRDHRLWEERKNG